jgi:hypothetical protein
MVNRNLDQRRLIGAVLLDVTKVLDTIWVESLLYKLTVFENFVLPGENHLLVPPTTDVPNYIEVSYDHLSQHAGWFRSGWSVSLCCSGCM